MGFVVILILIILGFVAYKAYSKTHGVGTSPVSKTSAESNTAAAPDSIPEHSTVTSKTARSSVGSVLSSMAKSLAISGSIIAACIAVMLINQTLGIILMMLYSSYMVIKSSRKEMPLNKFTALLPGVMSILTFLIMLVLIDLKDPTMPIIGMGLGIVVGFLMARGHKVYTKGGVVYAKRTFFYILIWALSMLFTQGSTLAGMREITSFGFLLNGFSTAMMVVLSVFLFLKATGGSGRLEAVNRVAIILMLGLLSPFLTMFAQPAEAYVINETDEVEISKKAGQFVFKEERAHLPQNLVTQLNKVDKSYGYRVIYRTQKKHRGEAFFMLQYKPPLRKVEYSFDLFEGVFKSEKTKFKDAWRYNLGAGGKGYLYYDRWYKVIRLNGYETRVPRPDDDPNTNYRTRVRKTKRGELDYINCLALLNYNNWFLEVRIQDYPGDRDTFYGNAHEQKCKSTVARIVQRLKSIQVTNNTTPPPPSPNPNPTPTPTPFPDPVSDFEFSDDEEAAGILLAILMLLSGVGMNTAASAAMSGALTSAQEAANSAMTAEAENTSSDNGRDRPVLFDPDFGDELPVQDGSYEGGEIGQVWYDGQWLDRNEAAQQVADRKQEIDRENREREEYLDNFQKQNEREWQQKMADRDQRLRDEHNVYDEDQQAWVRDPNYTPPRTDLEEFYERIDYIDEHRHERSDKEQEAMDRIIERTGYNDGSISEDDLSEEDLKTIRKLSHVILDKENAEAIGKEARDWGAEVGRYEDVGNAIKWIGRQAAEVAEKNYTGGLSKGAISEFIYQTASNHDKPVEEILKNSSKKALGTFLGNAWSGIAKDDAPGRIAINSIWGGVKETHSQLKSGKGGDAYEIVKASFWEAAGGEFRNVFEGKKSVPEQSMSNFDMLSKKFNKVANTMDSSLNDIAQNIAEGSAAKFSKLSSKADLLFNSLLKQK